MKIYDCIILGSGPAGLTAAIYLKRAGYNINVITGNEVGGTLNKISKLENYPGFNSITGTELAEKLINQCENLNIELTYFTEISYIEYINNYYALYIKKQNQYNLNNADFYAYTIINAIGTIPRILNIPNESQFFGKQIHFCATCDGSFYKNKNVLVVGGGNSAFDFANYLSNICSNVTILHRRNEFRAEQQMINNLKQKQNINYILNSNIISYNIENNKIISINIQTNNKTKQYIFDGIFYALGFEKNNSLEIINSNEQYFECGDYNLPSQYHQVIIAAGHGAETAIKCYQYLSTNQLKS